MRTTNATNIVLLKYISLFIYCNCNTHVSIQKYNL